LSFSIRQTLSVMSSEQDAKNLPCGSHLMALTYCNLSIEINIIPTESIALDRFKSYQSKTIHSYLLLFVVYINYLICVSLKGFDWSVATKFANMDAFVCRT
jgi:hypothetical protein